MYSLIRSLYSFAPSSVSLCSAQLAFARFVYVPCNGVAVRSTIGFARLSLLLSVCEFQTVFPDFELLSGGHSTNTMREDDICRRNAKLNGQNGEREKDTETKKIDFTQTTELLHKIFIKYVNV